MARHQPIIDWIDLGVFSDNPGAQALYSGRAFRFLVAHVIVYASTASRIDEIFMTLDVSVIDPAAGRAAVPALGQITR